MGTKSQKPLSSIITYNELIQVIAERSSMGTVCRAYARYIVAIHSGNKSKAAEALEVDRRTIHRWEKEREEADARRDEGLVDAG